MMKLKSKLLTFFTSIFISLLLLEIFLSFINYPPELNKKFQRKDIEWMEKNVVLNSFGFRDKEFTIDKPTDVFRILALGDSYTYGWLVDNPQNTYPKYIEKGLNDQGIKTEVINAGSPGFSIVETFNKFIDEGKQFNPDLVIVGLNDDEANFSKTFDRPTDLSWNQNIKNIRLYQLTSGSFFKQRSEQKNYKYLSQIYKDPNSKEWADFSNKLLDLQKEAAKINAKVALIIYPHISPNKPNSPYDLYEYNQRFKEFAAKNNFILIDPLDQFIKYPKKEDLIINPLDPHPTAIMNKIAADAFLKNFNVTDYLKDHIAFTPQAEKTIISKDNLNIGSYQTIKNLNSSEPWVYFETKFDKDVQDFPLKDLKYRNSNIYMDHLQTTKSYIHSAQPGATILYYIYPKENGKIIIPKNIYGFEVIGLNHIFALEVLKNGTTQADYISPDSLIKNDQGIVVNFNQQKNYHVYRINLTVVVKQLDINPEGKIENITKTYLVETTQSQKSKTVVLPFTPKISSWAEFSGEDTKAYSYAFVDGKMFKVKTVKTSNNQIQLDFYFDIEQGQKVQFPVMADYSLEDGENIEIETTKE